MSIFKGNHMGVSPAVKHQCATARRSILSGASGNLGVTNFFPLAADIMRPHQSPESALMKSALRLLSKARAAEHNGRQWRAFISYRDAGWCVSQLASLQKDQEKMAKLYGFSYDFYSRGVAALAKEPELYTYNKLTAAETFANMGDAAKNSKRSYSKAGNSKKEDEMREKSLASCLSGLAIAVANEG